jgi:ankyrin repeat protein
MTQARPKQLSDEFDFLVSEMAKERPDLEKCRKLLARHPPLAKMTDQMCGTTLLMQAAQEGLVPMIGPLLDAGAKCRATDDCGEDALHQAVAACHRRKNIPEIIRLLVAAGADVNRATDNLKGLRPLHMAIKAGSIAAMDALIAQGADVNMLTHEPKGCTPLHVAAYVGNAAAVKRLIALGADPQKRCRNKLTPFETAKRQGHPEAFCALLNLAHANPAALAAAFNKGTRRKIQVRRLVLQPKQLCG